MKAEPRMLANHRRAFFWSLALLGACGASLFLVGRHAPEVAPLTTIRFVGRFDTTMNGWMLDVRNAYLTWICKVLNVIGGGVVTIPVRIAAVLVLALRRRWARCVAFALTWASSEIVLNVSKSWFHRGRPPSPLVTTVGSSFPSGHAVAGAATAVALVLSRVYLAAHWFSDVVAGTLLGAGIAIFWAAAVTECRDLIFRARGEPIPRDDAPDASLQAGK
ncbi:MAG: hypothetical protein E6F95_02980 [Actinobacteria bacterium]|nr:MAG: hypothetical protein E6F95_02980 [Actinomycetota bacterium]